MERRYVCLRNTLGAALGLVVGVLVLDPIAVKAVGMLPVISILTPSQNQEVSGYVTFYAQADSEGIASLQFQIDGQNAGSDIVAGSCRTSWNSNDVTDGLHTLQVVARDDSGSTISSQALTLRVNNFVAPPPTTPPPSTPTPTPPATPTPNPPSSSSDSIQILSPGANSVVAGTVPVVIAIPGQTSEVWVQLKDTWGVTLNSWGGNVSPSASAATVQLNASLGGIATANFSLQALAVVRGQQLVSPPVPVRIDNTPSTGPTPPPVTPPSKPTPIPPQSPKPPTGVTPRPASGGSDATRAPSRIMSSNAELVGGALAPRPGTKTPGAESASARSSTTTASQSKAGFKSVLGSSSKTQKSTAPSAGVGTNLPSGTIATVGAWPCTTPDPYAKHPTLKGECVSGTWFPRLRKVETRRQN